MANEDNHEALASPAARVFYWLKNADESMRAKGNRPAVVVWSDLLGVEAGSSEGYAAIFTCGQSLMNQAIETRALAAELPPYYPTSVFMQNFAEVERTVQNFAMVGKLQIQEFLKPMREAVWSELASLTHALHVVFKEPTVDVKSTQRVRADTLDLMRDVRSDSGLSDEQKRVILWHLDEVISALGLAPINGTRPVARAVDATFGAIARGVAGSIDWLMESRNGKRFTAVLSIVAAMVGIYSGASNMLVTPEQTPIIDLSHAEDVTFNIEIEQGLIQPNALPPAASDDIVDAEVIDEEPDEEAPDEQ